MYKSELSSIENVKEFFPDVLHKYRDWINPDHKTIITKQQVYFSPPSSFWKMGDPYDCRYPLEWDFSFDANRLALEAHFPYDKKGMMRKDYEFYLREQHRKNTGTPEAIRTTINRYYTAGTSYLGVLSLTGRNDNVQIWQSGYAHNFTGFCVGIDYKACLTELMLANVGGGDIIYVPRNNPKLKYIGYSTHSEEEVLSLHMELIHTKYDDFSFEEEYRLTRRFVVDHLGQEISKQRRLFTVPKHCFRSVTFGYLMPQESIDEIIDTCKDQSLPVSFFKATLTDAGTVDVSPYLTA